VSSDFHDLDDLASLWTEEPDADKQGEFQAAAARVNLRARLLQHADLGLGILIAAAVLFALLLQPTPATVTIGLLGAGAVLWSSWKRHVLRQMSSMLGASSRTDLIDLELRRVATDLKRSVIGLWATPPAMILFAMLAYSVKYGWSFAGFGERMLSALTNVPVGPAIIAAMLTVLVQQVQTVRRLRTELRRLTMLRGEYQEEARLDRLALG